MAFYTPDYRYQNGKKLLEELKGPDGELIRYYVAKNEEREKKLEAIIKEMSEVFNGIRKFTRLS